MARSIDSANFPLRPGSKESDHPLKPRWILCLVLLALSCATETVAQEKREVGQVPVLRYRNGNVDAQWIPYGRRWAIEGTPVTSKGPAVLVWGAVHPANWTPTPVLGKMIPPQADSVPPADYSESCWVKPRGSTTSSSADTFRLLFQNQYLGERYTVTLRFFGPFAPADLNTWISAAYNDAFKHAQTNATLQPTDIATIFQNAIETRIRPLTQSGEAAWQIRSENEGSCQLSTEPPRVVITSEQRDSILTAVNQDRMNDAANDQITLAQDRIGAFRNDPITEALRTELEALAAAGNSGLLKGDGDSLWRAVQRREAPPTNVRERLDGFSNLCQRHSLADSHCRTLARILNAFAAFSSSHADFVSGVERVERIRRAIIISVQDVFAPVALAVFTSTSWEDAQASSDRLRIGTAISFGTAPLGLGPSEFGDLGSDGVNWETFAMYSLKFYYYPVDKSLPDPYLGRFLARFSLALGVLRSSDLKYQGQKLSTFGGGLIPSAGIGFDLTRDFTLQFGTLFFREPTGTQLTPSSDTRARGSLFLSLGVDIDAANRVNTLLKGLTN